MTRPRLRILACASAVALLAAGCTEGEPTNRPGAGQRDRAVAVWARMTGCLRGHGYPDWPDAIIDADGRGTYPEASGLDEKSAIGQLQPVCGPILDELPPGARPSPDTITDAELATLRAFAACMRGHGAPQWPDPNPDGGFTLSPAELQLVGTGGVPAQCRAVYAGRLTVDAS
jgi:hypothetical protein